MEYVIVTTNGELYHHGVEGQKWGVRRYQNEDGSYKNGAEGRYNGESTVKQNVRTTKAAYKEANKDYNKKFNKAYKRSVIHLTKKARDADTQRWNDAYDAAEKRDKAKREYRDAKNVRKDAIDSTTRELNKKATLSEKLIYNNATRKLAAKYVVDRNMSVEDATKKAKGAAWRNTAVFLAAYGVTMYAVNKKMG